MILQRHSDRNASSSLVGISGKTRSLNSQCPTRYDLLHGSASLAGNPNVIWHHPLGVFDYALSPGGSSRSVFCSRILFVCFSNSSSGGCFGRSAERRDMVMVASMDNSILFMLSSYFKTVNSYST